MLTQGDSPHPLLPQLLWDACSFSLEEMRALMYKRKEEKGQKREFSWLSCPPSSNCNSPLFCPKTRYRCQASPRDACQRGRLEQQWCLGLLFHLFFLSFPLVGAVYNDWHKNREDKDKWKCWMKDARSLAVGTLIYRSTKERHVSVSPE